MSRLSAAETPEGLRRLVLGVYAILGPALCASLLVFGPGREDPRPLLATLGLLAAGAAWPLLRRAPKAQDWIFPVAIAPTVCCGIGFAACGARGLAYLAVVGAPLAWAAVLFELPVVLAALATSVATVFVSLAPRLGIAEALVSTLVLSPVAGLVAWVVFAAAGRLREARRELEQLLGRNVSELVAPDVAASMREAKDLERQERLLALAVEGSELSYWDWDLRTDRTSYGPHWPALLGYGRDEIEPRCRAWARLVHPDDVGRAHQEVIAHLRGETKGLDLEYRMRARSGDWRWVHSRGRAVERDSAGRVARLAGTHADVTRRREIEDRLREALARNERLVSELSESEERLRLALASGKHAEWDLDLGRRVFNNGARWWEMLGVKPGDVDDGFEGWKGLLHPDDLEGAWGALESCIEGRTPHYEGHYRVRHASGGWRWVRSRGRVVERGPHGKALRMTGTRTDVTEVEELQEKLLAATRLASVGTLAAGVAHEINNPLSWLSANLAEALERLGPAGAAAGPGGAGAAELRELLGDALQGARRIASIVKAMRSLGRPEDAGATEEIDVRAELLNALQMVRNQLVQRAHLEVEVPEALPRSRARTNELGRVFLNLLVNAAQAIPEGKASLNRIVVSACGRGGEVLVEVRDSGVGVARDDRERIFDAFFTTKPVGVGTGLGLSIARSIVEGAGGRIEFESEEGRGTTFRVRLPAVSPAAAAAPDAGRAPGSPPPRVRRRVLVIDDEPLVGRALERLLGRAHDVTVLSSAADALRRFDGGERWEAILCDFMMPELDGIGFYEALSGRERGALLGLAFITGGAFGDRAARFLAEHDVPLVQKPLDPPLLLEMVERLAAAGASARANAVPTGTAAALRRGALESSR